MTKAHDTETRADTDRFDTMSRDQTRIAVEEIKAGAGLLDTQVIAGHEHHATERQMEHELNVIEWQAAVAPTTNGAQ